MREASFVIIKRGLFYRPNRQGYTGIREEAGRYTKEEARDHALGGECYFMPLDQAPEFLPAAYNDLVIRHLTNQRDTALSRIRELEQKIDLTEKSVLAECYSGRLNGDMRIKEGFKNLRAALSSKDQEKTNG